jgi:O-antigen ligase
MAIFAPAGYLDRMETSTTIEEGDTSYGRIQLWKAGLYMLVENPLTGVGLGAYPSAYGRTYSSYVEHYTNKWHVAHSSYITMAAELGLGGIIIYLYIIYLIFKQNTELRRLLLAANQKDSLLYTTSNAITISLVAYVVGSTFLTACYYPHLYLLLSLTVALGEITRRELALAPESDVVPAPGRPASVVASSHG